MHDYDEINQDEYEFIEAASPEELGNGERLFIEVDDLQIVLFNIAGEFFATEDVCSHDDGPLGDGEIEGYKITCPRHGAKFDLRSGKALTLPAIVDIPSYPVRVVDNKIVIGIPNQ